MITDKERVVFGKVLAQAQGTMDNLLAQKKEAVERVAVLDDALTKAQVELDAIKGKLQPDVAAFDAAVAAAAEALQ